PARGGGPPPAPATSSIEGLELCAQARELLALGLDDLRARLVDEAAVAELALGAGDVAFESFARLRGALRLGRGVDGVLGQDRDAPAGDLDGRHGLGAVAAPLDPRE